MPMQVYILTKEIDGGECFKGVFASMEGATKEVEKSSVGTAVWKQHGVRPLWYFEDWTLELMEVAP